MTQMNECSFPSAAGQPVDAEGALVDRHPPSVQQIGITTRNIYWPADWGDCEVRRPRYSVWESREAQAPVLLQLFWVAEQASSYAARLVDAGRDAFPLAECDRLAYETP